MSHLLDYVPRRAHQPQPARLLRHSHAKFKDVRLGRDIGRNTTAGKQLPNETR
jgi:hypothetical protein